MGRIRVKSQHKDPSLTDDTANSYSSSEDKDTTRNMNKRGIRQKNSIRQRKRSNRCQEEYKYRID